MKRIHLLRPGTFSGTDGTSFTFSAANLAAIAKNYDPASGEAPLTVGHPKTDHPAFGWVEKLEFDAGTGNLYAIPKQVEPEFASAVERGAFKKISVALFGPTQAANPKPGDYYIRHVGFLGAHVPAVPGLQSIEFAAADQPEVSIEFGAPGAYSLATIIRRLRDFLIGDKGLEIADNVIPDYAVRDVEQAASLRDDDNAPYGPAFAASSPKGQAGDHTGSAVRAEIKRLTDAGMTFVDISDALGRISENASRSASIISSIAKSEIHNPPESLLAALKSIKPPVKDGAADLSAPIEESSMTTVTQAQLDQQKADLDAREKKIKDQEAEFAAQATAARRTSISADVDVAVKEGRVLPAERGLMVELAARLGEGETIEFAAEDGSKETVNLFERWSQFLKTLPPRVDVREHSAAAAEAGSTGATFAAPKGFEVDSSRLEIHNKALAYQATHPGATYEQAVALAERS